MSESSDSSDSEAEQKQSVSTSVSRLGKCEVCGIKEAMYTCPKCEVKTCCLNCANIHKTELECDGVRDRTKFIRIKDYTNTDLLSDYRLLEECARFLYGKKRDEKKKFTRIDKELPVHLYKLKTAARNRGTALQFLAQNFARHTSNTTFYDWKTNVISWRVEWLFPNATPQTVKFVDERCPEVSRLSELLDKYLNPTVRIEGSSSLGFYHAVGFSGVKVLLKAEKVRGSSKKYFELDPAESLGDNLAGKCVVEFPLICVVLKDHAVNFDIIPSDDEFDCDLEKNNEPKIVKVGNVEGATENKISEEVKATNGSAEQAGTDRSNGFGRPHASNWRGGFNRRNGFDRNRGKRNGNRELLTEKFAKEKKLELVREIKAENKKKPKNLLFTTGYSSDESLGVSDDSEKDVKLANNKI